MEFWYDHKKKAEQIIAWKKLSYSLHFYDYLLTIASCCLSNVENSYKKIKLLVYKIIDSTAEYRNKKWSHELKIEENLFCCEKQIILLIVGT